ncbi:alpha/beta hydrolase [Dictyobacter vulcani]|uniref:Alpha/beta hydrolase n=1 Tax=Dictyobacter vulcani TaxID=2607529 RepID=A0A5J4KGS2_9CHLR|nr:alpha/beta hydrolase [Dictyobacter vulcani]GER88868.1 alpha/beta hydrolase [Dictyobacter vulcani]
MFKRTNVRYPRPSLKSLLWGSLGGSAGILAVIIGVGLYIVETLTRPKRLATFALYTFSPFELGIPAEDVTFPSLHNDYQVNGWYVPHPGATTTIVVSPGYRGSRSDVLGLCALLWKAGHNVLVFEYYGHGTVVGMPVTLGYREINDFLGAVAYAKQRAPEARLGAVGYSMGAAVSIMGTARSPEIEALVADSAFATHRRVVEFAVSRTLHLPFIIFEWVTDLILWLRAGYRFNQVEPLRDIARISPRPVMIIHGMKDTIVDPHDAPLLYKAAGEPRELWLVQDVEHCGAYFFDRVEYMRRVNEFFDVYLRQRTPVSPDTDTDAQSEGPTSLSEAI